MMKGKPSHIIGNVGSIRSIKSVKYTLYTSRTSYTNFYYRGVYIFKDCSPYCHEVRYKVLQHSMIGLGM